MESSSKRRKLGHSGPGLRHSKLIDFQSVDATRLSTASIFTLQTDELLKGARLDYGKTLKGAEEHLHNLKGIIESIPQHDAAPVSSASTSALTQTANHFRSTTPASNSRRNTTLLFPIQNRSQQKMPRTKSHTNRRQGVTSLAATAPRPWSRPRAALPSIW